jgi:hypothetical protein
MTFTKRLLTVAVAILFALNVHADGWNSFILNYPKSVFGKGSQTWQVATYNDRWTFFANRNGLLQFNGLSWNCFPLHNGIDLRSVSPSADGKRIYVGGINEFGFFTPSPNGKLVYTCLSEMIRPSVPIYYAHDNTGRPATRKETLLNQIPVEAGQTSLGCTSFYLDAGFDPLFPFGYGLSYTTFAYSNIHLASTELKETDKLSVSFDLTNTGKYEGTEVAQLYIQDVTGSVTRPVKELKHFERITLKPGESKTVRFELPISNLAFYNIDMKKVVEPGDFRLWIAGDSQSGTPLTFKVTN